MMPQQSLLDSRNAHKINRSIMSTAVPPKATQGNKHPQFLFNVVLFSIKFQIGTAQCDNYIYTHRRRQLNNASKSDKQ